MGEGLGGRGIVPFIINIYARDFEKRIITSSCRDSNPGPSSPVTKYKSYLTCKPYIKLRAILNQSVVPVIHASSSSRTQHTRCLSARWPVDRNSSRNAWEGLRSVEDTETLTKFGNGVKSACGFSQLSLPTYKEFLMCVCPCIVAYT